MITEKDLLTKIRETLREDIVAICNQDDEGLTVYLPGGKSFRVRVEEIK